jgi:hypothetical protein
VLFINFVVVRVHYKNQGGFKEEISDIYGILAADLIHSASAGTNSATSSASMLAKVPELINKAFREDETSEYLFVVSAFFNIQKGTSYCLH